MTPFDIPVEAEPPRSGLAQQEAAAIAGSRLRKLERDGEVEEEMHRGAKYLYRCLVLAAIMVAAVWLWHLVTPESWRFLTPTERFDLQNILISAIGSKFVSDHHRKWIAPKD